ncbi:MAG: sensor histidine kinase [Nocardioides sp.]
MTQSLHSWRQRRVAGAPVLDVALAAVLAVVGVLETGFGGLRWLDQWHGDPLVNALVVTAGTLALSWRKVAPTGVLCLVLAALAGLAMVYGASQTTVAVFAAAIAIYSAAAYSKSLALVAALVALGVLVRDLNDTALVTLGDHVWSPMFAGLAFAAGVGTRLHQGRVRAVEQRNATLQEEQADLVASVMEEERRRIARELHDVVSHSLGVVVLQAGAAEQVLDEPEKVRAILQSVRSSGLEAIGEMGTLLDVLRAEGEPSRHPQPTLGDLPSLIARSGDPTVEVTLQTTGDPRPLPAALELSAYRIAQEGLTNALKHARASRVIVTLRYTPTHLEVEVADDGTGTAGGHGTRRGLAGMGERVAIFGGELSAGARPTGGWSLLARLPVGR